MGDANKDKIKEKINSYFSIYKPEIYDNLKKLMEIKSRTDEREKTKEALAFVLELAASFGMKTTLGKYEDVGVIEIGEGEETLGLLAHVDVVPEGDISAWEFDPFTLTQKDGVLYGRGIVDDKGPVIMSLYALRFVKENVPQIKRKIQLIVGTSEETVWNDMVHFKEEFPLPDYGYSPDGNFPIYHAENGYIDIILAFDLNPESEAENYTDVYGGTAPNGVPSEAKFTLNGEEKVFKGKAAHSSAPWLGENAILKMAAAMPDPKPDFARFLLDFFPEDVYSSKLTLEKDPSIAIDGEVPPTTITPTLIRQIGKQVGINFNVRQAMDIPNANILAAFEREKDNYHFELSILESLSPIYVDRHQPWIQRMARTYEFYGLKNEFLLAPGCTYAKTIPNFVCWGPLIPGDLDCAHMENEQSKESSYFLAAEIYTMFLYEEAQLAKR
jgi:succinyl-diaminopimelate desuccinylase